MPEAKEIQQNNFGVGKFQKKPQLCIEKKNPFAPFLHPPKNNLLKNFNNKFFVQQQFYQKMYAF